MRVIHKADSLLRTRKFVNRASAGIRCELFEAVKHLNVEHKFLSIIIFFVPSPSRLAFSPDPPTAFLSALYTRNYVSFTPNPSHSHIHSTVTIVAYKPT